MRAGSRSTFLTYEPYYGLKEKPFSLSADPRFLYKSQAHAPTFEALRAGIRRREGLIVLTGEPGTGKTTLCRGVLEALDRKTFCTLVPDPFVSREDLLKMLLLDFGVMSVEDLRGGRLQGLSRPELSYPLYEFLKSLVPLQAYAVMIIDEAQNLSSQLLEEIRILSDLEGPEKLLQLVLVGQPELRAKLKDHSMRQVDQRVSVRVELTGLDRPGVGGVHRAPPQRRWRRNRPRDIFRRCRRRRFQSDQRQSSPHQPCLRQSAASWASGAHIHDRSRAGQPFARRTGHG